MITKLKKNLPHDIYRAEWNAVSADGHPVSGVIPFSIGKADGGSAARRLRVRRFTLKQPLTAPFCTQRFLCLSERSYFISFGLKRPRNCLSRLYGARGTY